MSGHRAIRLGRLIVTTTMQGQGAPVIDRASGTDLEKGDHYRARAILLKPWKRGERSIRARALVVGWFR